MAAREQLAIVLLACLPGVGDRVALSWEQAYNKSVRSYNQADFEGARARAEVGYRNWRQRPQSRAFWLFRLTLAESLIELDRTKDALPLLETAAPAPEVEARRLADLAMVQFRKGQYDPAQESAAAAGHIARRSDRDVLGKINLVRGMLQLRRDQTSDAEVSLRQALAAVEGSDSLIEAYTLSDLGFLDLQRFRYDEALYWFTRARDMAKRDGLLRPLELAMGNLGATYLNLGDFDRAAENLASAAKFAEELHDHLYQMPWLTLLGETWDESGDLNKAAESYRKAQALASPDRDRVWLSNVLYDLSKIALKTGDLGQAEDLNSQGAAVAQQAKSTSAMLAHEIQAAAIAVARQDYSKGETTYKQSLTKSVLAKDPVSTFHCHAGLADLYRKAGTASKADAEFRAAIAAIDQLHSTLHQDESKFSLLSSLVDFYRDYVDFLIDHGDPEGAFRVAESSRARVLEEKLNGESAATQSSDVETLKQEARASGTVLLSYWLAPSRSLLWVFDATGLHSFDLLPESEIAAQVHRYNDAIQRGDSSAQTGDPAGTWLFTNLLAAHYRMPSDSHVVIEADGVLHQLNFETLPAPDGRFWIEDATISVAPSLALLQRAEYSSGGRLLAFGDPGYDGTEFQRLSNVQAEMKAVESHFPQKSVYVSTAATPQAYRAAHPELFSTLHFASHAVANRESPLDSAIVLAGPPDKRKLYAREILQQHLTAQLVTLSACQTAGSRTYYGEGLTGFSWAFLSAGARNVVAGLWDVDDRATAALMKDFYDELASGLSPVSALRRAKLKMIASSGAYRKPRYWAAFETFTRALY